MEWNRMLVLNTGSSTLKWSVFDPGGAIRHQGTQEWAADGAPHGIQAQACLRSLPPCDVVVHRIVHGGSVFSQAVSIDAAAREKLESLASLDELHMRPALAVLDAAVSAFPQARQVAVFDTAFHRTMSLAASGYGLPKEWTDRWDLRRFGFHGLSVRWSVDSLARLTGRSFSRAIVAHLGSGCSVTAVADGRSADTTMGFTPLEGLMMSTRAGSVDAGVLFFLQKHGISPAELEEALVSRSGLLGVSGLSSDMREIIRVARQGHPRAQLAYDRFVHYAKRAVGAMAGVLGGVDALVFTGGVGEHQPQVRADIAEALGHGCIDPELNETLQGEGVVSGVDARPLVLVVHAREDLVAFAEAGRFLAA